MTNAVGNNLHVTESGCSIVQGKVWVCEIIVNIGCELLNFLSMYNQRDLLYCIYYLNIISNNVV